jgi:hypothetical protein
MAINIDKQQFKAMFMAALEKAAANAEKRLQIAGLSRNFLIELHGAGSPGEIHDIDSAVDKLHVGGNSSYPVIDVAVLRVRPDATIVFVRPGGHGFVAWEAFDLEKGEGPFIQATCASIEILE